MNSAFEKRLLVVWLALSAITVLQAWLTSVDVRDLIQPNAAITFSVIGMALIKVRFIMREFMEVRHAPVLLCRLTDAWLALTTLVLLGTYFVGMALTTG